MLRNLVKAGGICHETIKRPPPVQIPKKQLNNHLGVRCTCVVFEFVQGSSHGHVDSEVILWSWDIAHAEVIQRDGSSTYLFSGPNSFDFRQANSSNTPDMVLAKDKQTVTSNGTNFKSACVYFYSF